MKNRAVAFCTLALLFLGALAFSCPAGKSCKRVGVKVHKLKVKWRYRERACDAGNHFRFNGRIGSYSTQGDKNCHDCIEGSYTNSPGMSACLTAPAGTYQPSKKGTHTIECPVGHFCPAGSGKAIPCQAGTSARNASEVCTDCEAGTYSSIGWEACHSCPPGHHCQNPAVKPIKCVEGTFSIGESLSCTDCPAGSFSGAGAKSCKVCPAGTFSSRRSSFCSPCLEGSYSQQGASECTKCPPGFSAPTRGSTFCEPCQFGMVSEEG